MPPRVSELEVGGLVFDADFDSGNCARVEQRGENEFALWTSGDCEGTPFQTGFRTWFHFSVRGAARGRTLHFIVHNMNPQGKLFKFDMRPVWRCLPSQPAWERVRSPATTTGTKEEDNFVLRFRHKSELPPEETLFFAFCYPHSYADCMARLAHLDSLFGLPPASPALLGDETAGGGGPADQLCTEAALAMAADGLPNRRPAGVYYHRELLGRSLHGRRLDLLTVTAPNEQLDEREAPLPEGLLPEGGERPHRFGGKRVFFLSARVHPGEVPASHVFDGMLAFLLREHDPRAKRLRERFVFKLVPMLNPDGVWCGHYRADTRGVNLNRVYLDPSAAAHPTIYAAQQVVRQHLERGELMWYIDLHGHATKRGCFLYGNALASFEQQVENVMYARLCALNSRWFDFAGSVFSQRNMYSKDKRDGLSKEGSGRVGTFKLSGEQLTYCYTLECNYNMGKVVNMLPEKATDAKSLARDEAAALSPPSSPPRGPLPKYTPDSWRDVGKALALAALDIIDANPASRLGLADKREASLQRMRGCVSAMVRSQARKQAARAARRAGSEEGDDEDDDDEEEEHEEQEEDEHASSKPEQRNTPPATATGSEPTMAPPPQASTAPKVAPPEPKRDRAASLRSMPTTTPRASTERNLASATRGMASLKVGAPAPARGPSPRRAGESASQGSIPTRPPVRRRSSASFAPKAAP